MPDEGSAGFIRPEKFWHELGLRAHQTIVHLGCGAGFYLISAAHIVGHKGKVIGVDILPEKLVESEARARREGVGDIVQTIRGNLETEKGSTLDSQIADWVLVANILHQSDPIAILREARRIVKPEGTVIVVEWDTKASPFGPPDEVRLSHQQVLALGGKVGLVFTREFEVGPYHYGLLFTLQTAAQ